MSYVNASVWAIEDSIRSLKIMIEEGKEKIANLITEAEDLVREGEETLAVTQEAIKSVDEALSGLRGEYDNLSKQISDLRWEATMAYQKNNKSSELSATSLADYYAKKRDEIDMKIQNLNEERNKLFDIKYQEELMLSQNKSTLANLQNEKVEFDRRCEQELCPLINRMEHQASAIRNK